VTVSTLTVILEVPPDDGLLMAETCRGILTQ
jgi:hypothetical protein